MTSSVIVIGGGAVGLSVAESLATRGVSVTTLERDRCGLGASAGNAGWITPSLAIPVPGPGVIAQSLRWLVNPSGPLWIRPTVSPALLGWISRFVISCRRSTYRRGLAALQAAAARTTASFDSLAERGLEFEYHADDLLYPTFSAAERDHLLGVAAGLRQAGSRLRIDQIGRDETLALEPALSDRVIGGLIAEGERRVRPESLVAGLKRRVESLGADVIEGADVAAVRRDRDGWLVSSLRSEWRAETVVLANGVPARQLLGALGVGLPLAAAKGYSRTFARTATAPARPTASSLSRSEPTWNLAVCTEMPSRRAMVLFEAPSASSARTSSSRGVSAASTPACPEAAGSLTSTSAASPGPARRRPGTLASSVLSRSASAGSSIASSTRMGSVAASSLKRQASPRWSARFAGYRPPGASRT